MKKSFKLMMGLVIAVALPMFLTSCEDILGEWDKPTPQTIETPSTPSTPVVDNNYYVWDGTQLSPETIPTTGIQEVTDATASFDGGFYIVKSDITIANPINITADSKLILCDGTTLTVNAPIEQSAASCLCIYGQENQTGKLIVTPTDAHGIWAKDIEIHGGDLYVKPTTGAFGPSGIKSDNKLSIFGGKIITYGDHGIWDSGLSTALPGGSGISGKDVIIKGKAVVKTYGADKYENLYHAWSVGGDGINITGNLEISGNADVYSAAGWNGQGIISSNGDITISGGKVEAKGEVNGNGMKAWTAGKGIAISGGEVTATGGVSGDGMAGAFVNITGGSVNAIGGNPAIEGTDVTIASTVTKVVMTRESGSNLPNDYVNFINSFNLGGNAYTTTTWGSAALADLLTAEPKLSHNSTTKTLTYQPN